MISKADILAKLFELKPMLREEYAVLEIGLFGSYADSSISLLYQLPYNLSHTKFLLVL